MRTINLTIVSGCLALQNRLKSCGVQTEELFHQILVSEIEKNDKIKLNINIIHYERFKACLDKIIDHFNRNPIDLLVFQVRGHHYCKLIKLLGRYTNDRGERKWTVNLPGRKISDYEKYPTGLRPCPSRIRAMTEGFKSMELVRKLYYGLHFNELTCVNYLAGSLIGNEKKVKQVYLNLINGVIALCREKKIPLIFIGVVSCPLYKMRNYYAERLNAFVMPLIIKQNIPYMNLFGYFTENNEYKFMEDGTHLNPIGHREISTGLIAEMQKILAR